MTVLNADHSAGTSRERVLNAAYRHTVTNGWSSVTMSKIANSAGVSRQTVYNEFGSKSQLAESLVLHELDRFLNVIGEGFAAHPDDVAVAISAAVGGVLRLGTEHTLLVSVMKTERATGGELIALLTSNSSVVLAVVSDFVVQQMATYDVKVPRDQMLWTVDVVIRTVLSHIVQPAVNDINAVDGITWAVTQMLDEQSSPRRDAEPDVSHDVSTT